MSGSKVSPFGEKRLLRINEFCAAYNVSRSTAYKLMKERKLETVLILGRRLVPVESAEKLVKDAA